MFPQLHEEKIAKVFFFSITHFPLQNRDTCSWLVGKDILKEEAPMLEDLLMNPLSPGQVNELKFSLAFKRRHLSSYLIIAKTEIFVLRGSWV